MNSDSFPFFQVLINISTLFADISFVENFTFGDTLTQFLNEMAGDNNVSKTGINL